MAGVFGGIAGYGGGPERTGCGYSSDAAVYGYEHFIVPDVQREHPDWALEQVRQEALIRFNLRFSENISSLQCERKGESSTTVWRKEMLDGEQMLVIHGGKYDGYTLDRFWHESLQYDKEKGTARSGNIEEYHAQKRIQQAILTGEITSSVSIIGHPESVKLIQTFHRGSDGLYYSEQIDLEGLTGRTLTFAEGKTVMAALHHDHKQRAKIADVHHDHFMVTQGEITSSEVKTIAQAVVLTSSKFQPTNDQRTHSKNEKQALSALEGHISMEMGELDRVRGNTLADMSRIIFRDTGEAIRGITLLLHDKEKRKEAMDRLFGLFGVQKVRRIFGKEDQLIDKENESAISLSTKQTHERLTLGKIREKPVRIGEVIQKRHQEIRHSIRSLAIVADTRVGIAAIPFLIASLAKELPRQVKAVEKSIGRHERRKRRIKLKEVRIMRKQKEEKKLHGYRASDRRSGEVAVLQSKEKKRFQKTKDRRLKRVSETKRVPEPRKKKSKEQKTMRLRELVRHKERKPQPTKKKEKQTVFPERSVQKSDVVLRKMIVRLARKLEKNEKVLLPVSEGVKQQRKEKIVTKFTFAWVLWLLQETNSRHSRIDNPNNNKLEQSAIILQKEPTQWILLSIIWYLAMIREKKVYSIQHTAYRKKKNLKFKSNNFTLSRWQLPNQAIIFAYGS